MTEPSPLDSERPPAPADRLPARIKKRILSRAIAFWLVVAGLAVLFVVLDVLIGLSILREPEEWDVMRWLLAIAFVLPIGAALVALLWYGRQFRGAAAKTARAEDSFRIVASTMGDGIVTIDSHSRIQFVNDAVSRIFGYSKEELLGKELTMLMPERLHARHRAGIQRYVSTNRRSVSWESLQFDGRHKDGRELPLEISIGEHFVDGERVLTGIVRDITERKRAEERFRLAVEAAPTAIVAINERGSIELVNALTERLFGYRREELLGKPVEVLVPERFRANHPEFRAGFFADPQVRAMGVGRDLYGRRKDGSEFPVEIGLNPITTEQGVLVLSAIVDITERKRAEEALEQSEEKFRGLIETAPDGIFVVDPEGIILEVNPSGEVMVGRSRGDLVGHPITELASPEQVRLLRSYVSHRAAGHPGPEVYEGLWIGPGNQPLHIHLKSKLVRSPRAAAHLVMFVRDVTERWDLERKLVESERWASMGRLASFVAHEINTPLTNISLLTASVARRVSDPEAQERLKKISAQGKIAASITSELLRFARPGIINPVPTDLTDLVKGAIEQTDVFRQPGTEFRADLGSKPVVCDVDPLRIHEVVVNLLKNAYDATPSGRVKVRVDEQGQFVALSVADTGAGIPPEIQARIFEPFFTTKKKGEGTGLGLAICRNFVVSHGGDITVASEVGKGSTFTVFLPKQPPAAPPPAA